MLNTTIKMIKSTRPWTFDLDILSNPRYFDVLVEAE